MDQAVMDQTAAGGESARGEPTRGEPTGPLEPHPGTAPAPAGPFRLTADRLCVRGPRAPLLEPTSLTVRSGQAVLVAGDPGHGHTALALALGGRLFPHEGTVRLDDPEAVAGAAKAGAWASGRRLRGAVALVDVPGVSEPDDMLPLVCVVREELAMAGRRAGRAAAARWLAQRGLAGLAGARVEAVPGAVRTRVLAELASVRPGVGILVLTAPDRHGTGPAAWLSLADTFAAAGFAVVATCAQTSAALLGRRPGRDAVPLGGAGAHAFDSLGEAW